MRARFVDGAVRTVRPRKIGSPIYLEVVMDYDRTSGDYCQHPLLRKYNIEPQKFWDRKEQLLQTMRNDGYDVGSGEIAYMVLMIRCARGLEPDFQALRDLNNSMLRESGKDLDLYPGVPDFIPTIKHELESREEWGSYNIKVDFHVVTTGLREVLMGSKLAPHLAGFTDLRGITVPSIHGSEFIEEDGIIAYPLLMDPYLKGSRIFTITKGGANLLNIEVPEEERRSLKKDVFVLGDGPSDKAMFALAKRYGGRTMGVYDPEDERSFMQTMALHDEGVLDYTGPIDFRNGGHTFVTMKAGLMQMANKAITELEGKPTPRRVAPVHLNAVHVGGSAEPRRPP